MSSNLNFLHYTLNCHNIAFSTWPTCILVSDFFALALILIYSMTLSQTLAFDALCFTKSQAARGLNKKAFTFSSKGQLIDVLVDPLATDVLYNNVDDKRVLRRASGESWRGAREKSPAFMQTLIESCTGPAGRVVDLTTSTGMYIFWSSVFLQFASVQLPISAHFNCFLWQGHLCMLAVLQENTSLRWRQTRICSM